MAGQLSETQLGRMQAYWDAANQRVAFKPGTRFGVYQALSTRAFGEVIDANAY